MRIGLSCDLKESVTEKTGPEDALEEYDSRETAELIASSLESTGNKVTIIGGGKDFLNNILREKIDFVFNIAEGRGTYRSREGQVPSVLEMLGIPYSGSDPECLTICLDKPLTKQLIADAGLATPKWQIISEKTQKISDKFPFPVILKPAFEGSSKGIRLTSVADNREQAVEKIDSLIDIYKQPVMVEEFITGDEVTVGMAGNSPPRVVGIMRVLPKKKTERFVYSLEVKRDYLKLVDYEVPAKYNRTITKKIEASSIKAFTTLGCRDFARLDYRISPDGISYFIEINPLPGLGNHSDLVIMTKEQGWTHKRLVSEVLNAALKRYGM